MSKTVSHAAEAAYDTLSTAAHNGGDFGGEVMHHLTDIHSVDVLFWKISLESLHFELFGLDMSITKPVIFMWLAGLVLLVAFSISFRGGRLLGSKLAHILEVYILFIRDEVVYPILGEKDGRRMLPFFLSVFFFILTCNLLGLVPSGGTATANINVTAGLAIIAFLVIQGMGIAKNGLVGHFKALVPHGLPAFVVPIMIPVEIVSMFAKPFALCIRLFANMVAGHAVIIVLLMLIILSKSFIIAPMPVIGVVFISSLEIFVAHLQAFIFTILTVLFTSMTMHPAH